MWQAKYKPRNYVPWGIIAGSFLVCSTIPLVIRWILAKENALRDEEERDTTHDNIYVERVTLEGEKIVLKVPKVRDPSSYSRCRSDPFSGLRNSWTSRIGRTVTSATPSDSFSVSSDETTILNESLWRSDRTRTQLIPQVLSAVCRNLFLSCSEASEYRRDWNEIPFVSSVPGVRSPKGVSVFISTKVLSCR